MDDRFFWEDPLRDDPDAAGTTPLALTAPKVVPLRERPTFPLVARHAATLRERLRGEDFRAQGTVVAVDVERNEIFTGFTMDREGLEPSESEEVDDEEVLEAKIVAPYVIELRERASLPWRPADYAVTVTLGGKWSNAVRVSVRHDSATYDDLEVAKYLASLRGARDTAGEWPRSRNPLPSYERLPSSPPLPDAPGIALAFDGRLVVHGSFRVPSRAEDFRTGDRARAFARIHLVLVGDEDALAIALTIHVPGQASGAGAEIAGHFALDLTDYLNVPLRPQAHSLFAFSRDARGGPLRATYRPRPS